MKVTCSGCGRTLNVPDSALGKTVRCPACKTTVEVEETFAIMPDGPPAFESGEAEPGPAPGGLPPATTCPTCGFLLLPDADHCNRCGTDLATGERREDLVGYQASLKARLFGRTGWIVTLAVTAVIVVAVVVVLGRLRGYAEQAREKERKEEEARRKAAEPHMVPDIPAPKEGGRASSAAKPGRRAVPRGEDVEATFSNAFSYLANPSPSAQHNGLRLIADMGGKAVPLIEKKLADCADDANARKMLARALGKIPQAEASAVLIGLLPDADAGVHREAVEALGAHGAVAKDPLTAALGSDDASVRTAAARAAKRVPFPEHTSILVALLKDREPEVCIGAARALSARPGTADIYDALVEATGRLDLDVAAAASEALAQQKGALDTVLKVLAGRGSSAEEMRSPQTLFLAAPVLAWKVPAGTKMLATYLGGGKSSQELLEYVNKFLDVKNPVTRVETLDEARRKGLVEPQMVVAAAICLADTNSVVARSALRYISSMGELTFPTPLVVALGHGEPEFALEVARELARRGEESTVAALKRAVDGTTPQRKVMAAGVLARRGDDYGAELLRRAAAGETGLPPPLPGWAAYQYAFLEKGQGFAEFAGRAKNSPSELDRAYYSAAAAKLGSSGMLANLRGQLKPGSKGFHARVVVRLLGELKDADAKEALIYQLHQDDPELLAAVIESLRALGDASVVPAVVERMPQVKAETARVLREAVWLFGAEAEELVLKLLGHDSPLVRRSAMQCLTERGRDASKDVARKLVEMLQNPQIRKDLRKGLPTVLAAISGKKGKPTWSWREWAKVCGVEVRDVSEQLEYKRLTREWFSIDVPKAWKTYAGRASSPRSPGSPELWVKMAADPPGTPRARRKYRDERDFRKKRKAEIALLSTGRRGVRPKMKPGLEVIDEGTFYAGRAKMVGMRLIDEKLGRTTFYVFLFARGRKARFYTEVSMSSDTRFYDMYKTLFEKRMPRSIKADVE